MTPRPWGWERRAGTRRAGILGSARGSPREVFVAAYPQPGGRWQVSQDGGTQPRWNRNGRELLYLDPQNHLVVVEVVVTVPLEEELASPVTLMTDWTRRVEGR